mgnify:CR=1 FL=1
MQELSAVQKDAIKKRIRRDCCAMARKMGMTAVFTSTGIRVASGSVEGSKLIEKVRALEIRLKGETVQSVTEWANETFGPATIQRQVERAREEFSELEHIISVPCHPDKLAEEAADVCICLYRVIGTLDPEAINKKMKKNRARKWLVDGNGTAQHVGE